MDKSSYNQLLKELLGEDNASYIDNELKELHNALMQCDYAKIIRRYENIGLQTYIMFTKAHQSPDKKLKQGYGALRDIHADLLFSIVEQLQDNCKCREKLGGRNIVPPNLN